MLLNERRKSAHDLTEIRRGNCHDNAVAESFFSSLKHARIRLRAYKTREEVRQDVFDYIEMFRTRVCGARPEVNIDRYHGFT